MWRGWLIGVVLAGALAASCGGDGVDCPPDATATAGRATIEAVATAGLVPEGLVVSTATPDLSETLDRDDALARLHAEPAVSLAIDAVAANDVRALVGLVRLEEMPCWRRDVSCPAGASDGSLSAVDVGSAISFFVGEEELTRTLGRVLHGEAPELRYGARSRSDPDLYVLVFEGAPKEFGVLPVTDEEVRLTGVALYVRVGTEEPPIEKVTFLQEGGSGIARAYENPPAAESIILFSTPTAVPSACDE